MTLSLISYKKMQVSLGVSKETRGVLQDTTKTGDEVIKKTITETIKKPFEDTKEKG